MKTISSTTTTRYHVRVVGNIWQPGIECASEITVTAPMEYQQAEGETDDDYEIRMVQCAADHQLGDFREITGWEIERVRTLDYRVSPSERWQGVGSTVLLAFSEDQEIAFSSAMYPEDDDE